ncbi:MAG: hypothetical protein R3D01_10570 [Hyphomicrobiales bacterium]
MRADTFGYLQRCWPETSGVDASEARGVGRFAAELAAKGDAGASVTIVRTSNAIDSYRCAFGRAELSAVARYTRHMPDEFLSGRNNVTPAFYDYCQPLIGDLPPFARL